MEDRLSIIETALRSQAGDGLRVVPASLPVPRGWRTVRRFDAAGQALQVLARMDGAPGAVRKASTRASCHVHSGHSLTDTYTNGGIEGWPGDLMNLYHSQFGQPSQPDDLVHRRDVIPGSPMRIRWEENPDGPARFQIGSFDTLMITEAGPMFGRPTEADPTASNETLRYLLNFAKSTYLNARDAPGEVILWSIWPNTEGWIGDGGPNETAWSGFQGFRGCLPEYGRCFRFFAEYVTWKMHQIYPEMPANWRIWTFPGHAWWARVHDDIQAGMVPGISDHRQLFRDDIHPNAIGEYALAVFVHTMLYQVDCRTLDYAPDPSVLPAELDLYLKHVAWDVANSEASAGMGGTADARPVFDPAIHGDPLEERPPPDSADPAVPADAVFGWSATAFDGPALTGRGPQSLTDICASRMARFMRLGPWQASTSAFVAGPRGRRTRHGRSSV